MSEDKAPAGLDYQGRYETRGRPVELDDWEPGGFFKGLLNAMAITAAAVAIALFLASLFANPAHAGRRDGCCIKVQK